MADERGRVFRLIGTARDVTEHRRLQEELAQAQKLATLGTMAAGVAHEMGQPLNAIRISAEDCRMMMAEGQTDPAYLAESLDLVADQARRMGEILDQMRSLSRREASDEAEPFDPVVPVRRAIALVERHFGSEDVAIEQALEDPAGRVTGRAGQLEQVMINLLGNARDAIDSRRRRDGDQSPGRIKVRLDRVPGKPQVLIEVDDDGTGISPELAERMFDPFFTTKDASKGTGLGLSICSSLIAAMGGSIAARPLPRGTRLSIRLPLGPMPVEGDLAATAEEAGHG
jgi:C4-dicarboxylate-specific signal transduction histidine kinase